MASIAGIIAVRERLAYTTTKFAVVGLTKALATGSLAHGACGSIAFAQAALKHPSC